MLQQTAQQAPSKDASFYCAQNIGGAKTCFNRQPKLAAKQNALCNNHLPKNHSTGSCQKETTLFTKKVCEEIGDGCCLPATRQTQLRENALILHKGRR